MKKLVVLFFIVFSLFWFNNTFAWLTISPLKFEFDIEKSSSKTEKVKLTNNWKESITVYSSKEDFIAWDDSWTPKFIPAKDQVSQEFTLSNWIEIEDKNLTIAPGETKEINFKINVPSNVEPGWHYAAIFFSPWVKQWSQIAVVQRIWVLILVNVPWEVKIDWNLKSFNVWDKSGSWFTQKSSFENFPIVFETLFENGWNIHLKPKWKIELVDEDGNVLKNVWKETLTSPAWTYLWEKMVDYIPINDQDWNVLPKSQRKFESEWNGFWYSVLNEDGTKKVEFKSLSDYYADKAVEKSQYLMFWQKINTRTTTKEITAKYQLYYEWKDKIKKEFLDEKKFKVSYIEKYVWINYYLIIFLILALIWGWYYFKFIYPKHKALKEQKLREKILNELNENK